MQTSIDLEKLNKKIESFVNERDWDQFHTVKNLSMALSVECSELVEIFQWMSEEDSNKIKIRPDLKAKVEEEVADIFVYLLRILNKTEIDLMVAVEKKILKNIEKYPVELCKGKSTKYSEL